MLHLNKYIFVDICNKDLEKYNEIIDTIKKDYFQSLKEIVIETKCSEIRKIAHRLIGVVSLLEGANSEATYILKSLLNIHKVSNDFASYKYYINLLEQLNTDRMF